MNKCKECGKSLKNSVATHCSDECLFKGIEKSESLVRGNDLDTEITKFNKK
ncbi:MAG: hypothetical protein QGH95_00065 [Candidatus Nitrosopelagicus sp.]|jgi:hypothetical protein|nr:hypothetical protein [Candidatus Nitrosopelagicus sp.]|tara:strand:- start:1212 stop:1364 length:153 start_codon:yes stop_codon:yes gene_type:complete